MRPVCRFRIAPALLTSAIACAIVCLVSVVVETKPAALPAKIEVYLSRTYPGWKQTSAAINCIPRFQQAVVTGDFDGDGRRDYAVKFTHGRKGYILAFIARGTEYSSYVLIDTSAHDIRVTGMSIGRKGQRDENEEGRVTVLPHDAPIIGTCESEACPFVYRNGRFSCQ